MQYCGEIGEKALILTAILQSRGACIPFLMDINMRKQIFLLVQCVIALLIMNSCNKTKTVAADTVADAPVEVIDSVNDGTFVKVDTIEVDSTISLVAYYPQFSRIDLAVGEMPAKEDSAVVFCAAAAFTGTYLDEFKHTNIAGDHVSVGVRHEGYKCEVNTGTFAYYGGREWEFAYADHDRLLNKAAEKGGMAYSQAMMICNGEVKQKYRVNPKNTRDVNEFRTLCELNGQLCVIDSKGFVNFINFVEALNKIGVSHAIYMDMGEGWNYSWWRHSCGKAVEIHRVESGYTTNWITFYK